MNEGGLPGSLTTEVSWERNRGAVVWVGIFPLHHYWPLLAPFFGDALLPPQRRMEGGEVVAWTWRPVAGAPTSEETLALRRRLAGDLEALGDRVSDGGGRADLAALAAEMQRVVSGWAELPEADFCRYVARTAAGLRLHSWSATQAPEPRDPSAGAGASEPVERVEPGRAPIRPGHRARWIALSLLALLAAGSWYFLQRPKPEPEEPAAAAPSDASAVAPATEAPAEAASSPVPAGGESNAETASSTGAEVLPPPRTNLPGGAGDSTLVSAAARGAAGGGSGAAPPGMVGATGSAGGAGSASTPGMTLPPLTLQVGPSSAGPAAPAAGGSGPEKGSVPPAASGTGPNADQSPSAGGGGLPESNPGGGGENGPIAPAGKGSAHAAPARATSASASHSTAASGTSPASPSAAPSAAGKSPSVAPTAAPAGRSDANAAVDSANPGPPDAAKVAPPPDASAAANAGGDGPPAGANSRKADTATRPLRARSAPSEERKARDVDAGNADAGDGDRPGGAGPAETAGTPLPRDAGGGSKELQAADPTPGAAMHTLAVRLTPWRAEMLSDRILPTLPTAAGAAPASFSAEREREIANARARLQVLRQNLALAAAFRVTFSDGEEAVVPWPGPGFARRSQDGELLIRIAYAADGKVSIATAPGVAVSAEFTAETKSASAARQVFWQTLKGDPLPRHWSIASDPTARKLTIPLVAFSGARIGPDPTDFPVALTDPDSGWSFAGQLVEQAGQ